MAEIIWDHVCPGVGCKRAGCVNNWGNSSPVPDGPAPETYRCGHLREQGAPLTQGEPERGNDWVFLPEGPLPPEGEVVLCIDARGEYALDWISGHEKPEWGNDQPWEILCWRKPHAKPTQRPPAQPSPVVQTPEPDAKTWRWLAMNRFRERRSGNDRRVAPVVPVEETLSAG